MISELYESIVSNKIRLGLGNFLSKEIVTKRWIILSFWSIIHLLSGFGVVWYISKFTKSRCFQLFWIFLLLAFYEFIEYFMYTNMHSLFIPEVFADVLWDIIIGMLGACIYIFLLQRSKKSGKEKL